MAELTLLKLIQALYRFPTSGNRWHTHFSHTLRGMVFKKTCFNPNVWIKGYEGGYYYISTHTDDVLVVDVETTYRFTKLKETYTIKTFGALKVHLGCEYAQFNVGATTW